jgi:hypothetical protein
VPMSVRSFRMNPMWDSSPAGLFSLEKNGGCA